MYLWRLRVYILIDSGLGLLNHIIKKNQYFVWYFNSWTALTFRNSIPNCNTKNFSKLTVSSIPESFLFRVYVSVCGSILRGSFHSWRIPEMAFFVTRENRCLCNVYVFVMEMVIVFFCSLISIVYAISAHLKAMFVNSAVERKMQFAFWLALLLVF